MQKQGGYERASLRLVTSSRPIICICSWGWTWAPLTLANRLDVWSVFAVTARFGSVKSAAAPDADPPCRPRHGRHDLHGFGAHFPGPGLFLAGLREAGDRLLLPDEQPLGGRLPTICRRLDGLGIPATREEMYTTTLAIDYLRVHCPEVRRLFLLRTPSMISEFEAAGYVSTEDSADDRPDAVVVAFDMTLAYDRLCRATWWVKQGLPYLATNPDRVCPTNQPTVLVDCGSICSAIEHATGRRPDITLGKPDRTRFRVFSGVTGCVPKRLRWWATASIRILRWRIMPGRWGVLVLSGETTLDVVDRAPRQPADCRACRCSGGAVA